MKRFVIPIIVIAISLITTIFYVIGFKRIKKQK